MNRLRHTLFALLVALAAAPAGADPGTQFARVDADAESRPRALQIAVNAYVRDGARVELVGAVHIGDKAYYAALNERFTHYDALLFELVAPAGADFANQASHRKGLLSNAQLGMTRLLGLSFQLDEIDYGRPNFVHADLTPAELRDSMAERDESLYVYFWRIFFASIDEYTKDPLGLRDWEMLSAMVTSGDDPSFKIMMAHEMANMDSLRELLGEDSSTAIVGARNQRAIDVLQEQLDAGARRLGIFYGVAHMPDLEERLVNDLGFEYAGTDWVDAWLLTSE